MRVKTLLTPMHAQVLLVSGFIMATGNFAFFHKLLDVYPLAQGHLPFVLSVGAFFTLATALFLNLLCYGRGTPWVLAFFLVAASQAAYFMDTYGVVIDSAMLDNAMQTNASETADLLNFSWAWRTLLLGLVPALLVIRFRPASRGAAAELGSKLVLALLLVVLMVIAVAPFAPGYASFIREHKSVRFYANPTFFSYSVVRNVANRFRQPDSGELAVIAPGAEYIETRDRNELIILVVGETARADHFSLNGYARKTNPELEKLGVLSMKNVTACGTSTAVSVPCMFSALTHAGFDKERARHQENVLDVLRRFGVEILWRDNNSDSKGVAERVAFEDFRSPEKNPVCDVECRDIGMLDGLEAYIDARKGKDILIVLHQMGNHGPAYYKRYPQEFERYTPTCQSGELSTCTREEVINAYDNALLYTDFFLSRVIALLGKYDGEFETAMLYVSDHGESLGEYGMFLHGAPYALAPKAQTEVPVIFWAGQHFDYRMQDLRPFENQPVSHDDLLCTLLLGFEIDDKSCRGSRTVFNLNLDLQAGAAR